MQSMNCYKECGSQAAQKTIQLVDKAWKSYFKAIKDWKKNPSKYLGIPQLPKYLPKDGRQVFMLKNIQCSLKYGQFRISFKPFGGYTVKTHAVGKLMQCRFVPKVNYYVMEIGYEIEVANDGRKINADVNGAYQIMKKVVPDVFDKGIEGVGSHPIRLEIA